MHHFLGLLALRPGLGTGATGLPIARPPSGLLPGPPGVASSESVIRSYLPLRKWSTSRLRVTVVTQVMKGRTRSVESAQGAVDLDEYFLGQVGGVVGRAGEPIADVVDSPVILLDDLLPSRGIAGHTSPDQRIDRLVVVQSALPRGVTPGPNPIHCWSCIRG